MRNCSLVILALLASSGCTSGNDNVGDPADAAPAADAPVGAHPDATVPDAMPQLPDAAGDPCVADLPCPAPDSDRFMICGRLVDLETSALLTGAPALALQVSFYDALALATNPQTPPELTVHPDACGRFVSSATGHNGVTVPATTWIAVGVDDASTPFPGGDFADTIVSVPGVAGAKQTNVHAYATTEATDARWSGTMSPSFATQGVFVGIFIDTSKPHVGIYNGTPTPGVTLTYRDAPAPRRLDFYFSDTTLLERRLVGSLDVTGVNGTALFVNGSLDNFGGQGGTSPNCDWPSSLASTLPGVVFVAEREGTCP